MRRIIAGLLIALLALAPVSAGQMSLLGAGKAGGAVAPATLDPANKGTNQTLSNGNLTVTNSGGGDAMTAGTRSRLTGKYYLEVTAGGSLSNAGFGVMSPGQNMNTFIGTTGTAASGTSAYGTNWVGSVGGTTTVDVISPGKTFGLAVDLDNRTIWSKNITDGGNWNANGTANPATNTNGATLTGGLATGAIFPAFGPNTNGDTFTVNFGATAYVGTPPPSFGNW